MIKTLKHLNFSIVNMMSQNNIILNKGIFSEFQNSYLIEEKLINLNYYLLSKIKNFNIINLIDVIGIDTCLSILHNLNQINNRYYVPEILKLGVNKLILEKIKNQ